MSFKDDFLEALRSVKRDFFRESEYTETKEDTAKARSVSAAEGGNGDNKWDSAAEEASTSNLNEGRADGSVYNNTRQSDEGVYEAFKQASVIDDTDDNDDDADDFFDSDDGIHTGNEQSAQFRNFNPPSGESANAEFVSGGYPDYKNQTPSNDGRKIYDFSVGNLYEDDKTVISRNTVIHGTLQTDDSIRLLGQILGDIECRSNIVVAGKVRGNTTAANAYVIDAQVDGNMLCDDSINISNDAWILGNIRAQQAEIDGKIKGDIEIRHTISIGSSSSIIGNISADELEIKRGAFVNGQIIMYSPQRDVLDRFDHFEGI